VSNTAREVMTTELITVTPATPLREFARICAEDNISGAPVLNVDDSLAGLITKSDLLEGLLEADPRHGLDNETMTEVWLGDDRQVGEIMVPAEDIQSVAPDATAADMARMMAAERIHRVLVLDGGRCAGIVTSLDLLRHFGD